MIKLSLKFLKQYFFAVLGAMILVVLQSYGQIVLVMGEMRVILEKGVKASDMGVVRASSVNMILYTLLLGLCAIVEM